MLSLTVLQRQNLKARAHALDPVVIIGNAGLTPAVLDEITRSLKRHELIKIRANGERKEREAMMRQICETLNTAPVQHIGKILVVYQPQEDVVEVKKAKRKSKKPLTKKQMGNR
ncbi:MAG: YhbY family RNA-binding protein [Gallionellaceae bacterium]|jgi:putative YhbY family RNA-binding protein|nr:YhbY family RNA-binding protein [Gallionellaceae bacterium]